MHRYNVTLCTSVWLETQELPESRLKMVNCESSSATVFNASHVGFVGRGVGAFLTPANRFRSGCKVVSFSTFVIEGFPARPALVGVMFSNAITTFFRCRLPSAIIVPFVHTAFTESVWSTSFIWAAVRSDALHISSVFCKVKLDSLKSISLTLLCRIPNTILSRRISPGVMELKLQPSASFLDAVLY